MPVDLSTLLRDGDPTREIRRYIEQLQDAVRDGVTRHTLLEEERDRLAGESSRLRTEIEGFRSETRDARRDRDLLAEQISQHGSALEQWRQKVESAERNRLDAMRQREEAMQFYKGSQAQIEEITRIKDEAVKQRDAFSRQRDVAKKERDEAVAKYRDAESMLDEARKVVTESNRDDVQKQITSLRQARDTAALQCAELKQRVSNLEDEIANISYERDQALQTVAKASEEAAKFSEETDALRTNFEQAVAEAAGRNEVIKDETEELKKKIAALKRRNATLGEAVDSLTTEVQSLHAAEALTAETRAGEVAELGREAEKVAKEREAEMAEYSSKLNELRAAHENELQLARQQYEAAMTERDAARTRAQEREAEMDAIRSQLEETKSVMERLSADVTERARQMEALQADRDRAETAEEVLEESRQSLVDAQKQIEYVLEDRENLRLQMTAQVIAMEEKLKTQTAELAELKRASEQAGQQSRAHQELLREHEEHRLQMIETTAKLATAHAEIKQLGATLAEARLTAKRVAKGAAAEAASPEIADAATRTALTSLRRTFQDYLRQPSDFNQLNALQNYAQHLADRARENGQMVVQRVSSVFSALTRELYEEPEQATPSTMRTVGQSIEFIATMLKENDIDRRVNLNNVRAFAVDDDVSVLDMICEALQAAGVSATTTDSAGAALAELATSPYDLVILDVNLPELDGLELCSHMREIPMHGNTPVIFITGSASLENRVQFSLRGGSELLIKPFNLLELALRSVILIIKAKLKPAQE